MTKIHSRTKADKFCLSKFIVRNATQMSHTMFPRSVITQSKTVVHTTGAVPIICLSLASLAFLLECPDQSCHLYRSVQHNHCCFQTSGEKSLSSSIQRPLTSLHSELLTKDEQ